MLGGTYALVAFGLNMVWGVMNVVNAAHAHLVLLGAYMSYWLWILYGFDPLLSMIISIPSLFLIGLLLFRGLITPVIESPNLMGSSMLIFWGLAVALENVFVLAWTVDPRSANTFYVGTSIRWGLIALPITGLVGFVVAMGTVGLLYLFLKKSFIGKAIRATAQNRYAAMLMGIDVNRVSLITFGIGTATAAVAGSLISIIYMFYPSFAWQWLGRMFVICVLGSLGDPLGAILAGLILGVSESVVTIVTTAAWSPFVAYIILLLVLMLKPTGLLGRK